MLFKSFMVKIEFKLFKPFMLPVELSGFYKTTTTNVYHIINLLNVLLHRHKGSHMDMQIQ